MTSRTLALVFLCALAPAAGADNKLTLPADLVGLSKPTMESVGTLKRMSWELGRPLCFRGDDYYPGKFKSSLEWIQALPPGPERDKAQAYYDGIKAFADYEQNGPPEYGGWGGLYTKLKSAKAGIPTAAPTSEAETRTTIAALTASGAKAAELLAIARKVADYSFCGQRNLDSYLGQLEPAYFATVIEAAAETLAYNVRYPVEEAIRRTELALTDQNMNKYEMLSDVRKAKANLPALELWAPVFSKPADKARYTGQGPRLDAAEAKLIPVLVAEIQAVKPDKAVKDAKAMAIAKKFLASFEPYIDIRITEKLKSVTKKGDIKERGDRRYIGTTKYKAFQVQRIIKRSELKQGDLPALPGIDPAELCILDTGYLINYDAGFEVDLHTWMWDGPSEAGGPLMLCKNR